MVLCLLLTKHCCFVVGIFLRWACLSVADFSRFERFLIGGHDGCVLSPDTLTLQQHQGLGLLGLGGGDAFMVKLDKGLCRCGLPPHTDIILT